jgi:hypothetical protein
MDHQELQVRVVQNGHQEVQDSSGTNGHLDQSKNIWCKCQAEVQDQVLEMVIRKLQDPGGTCRIKWNFESNQEVQVKRNISQVQMDHQEVPDKWQIGHLGQVVIMVIREVEISSGTSGANGSSGSAGSKVEHLIQ